MFFDIDGGNYFRAVVRLFNSFLFFGLVLSFDAYGSDWRQVARSNDGVEFSVNYQWVLVGSPTQKIMTLANFPAPRKDPVTGLMVRSTISFQIADCVRKRIGDTHTFAYAKADGLDRPIGQVGPFDPPQWVDAYAGSVNRIILTAVCR